jgi:ribosomal protein L24
MVQNFIFRALILLISGIFGLVFGQTPEAAAKPSYFFGDVAIISGNAVSINTKTGRIEVSLTEKTTYKRVSAETLNMATATPGLLADISVGDKVTVSALPVGSSGAFSARTVYFVTKADVEAKNVKETEEWRRRGIAGKVASVNPQTNQITVELRNLMGSSNVTLTPKENAKFLRYAPDSIRYDEAKDSAISDVKAGDMLRALGDRSADGTGFAAEKIVTGAFQTIAGTVKSVDPEKNEVVIKNLQSGKDVTVVVSETSVLKKFPAEMAERMAGSQMGGAGMARPVGQGSQTQPVPQGGQAGQGQSPRPAGTGFGARPAGGIDDMLDRFPGITVADLKAGDMIAISSTRNGALDRIKAIKLVAGVEPFLRMAQMSGGGQRGQGVQGGFSIPGLDGIGF